MENLEIILDTIQGVYYIIKIKEMIATKPRIYEGTGSAIDDYARSAQNPKSDPSVSELAKQIPNPKSKNWAIFDKNNPKHKVILSLLHQAQWTTRHAKYGVVPDMQRLSNFLKSEKSPVKKPLKKMTSEETEKVISALSGIVKSRYK